MVAGYHCGLAGPAGPDHSHANCPQEPPLPGHQGADVVGKPDEPEEVLVRRAPLAPLCWKEAPGLPSVPGTVSPPGSRTAQVAGPGQGMAYRLPSEYWG